MAESFAALLLAHLLGDFVAQSDRMAIAKAQRSPSWLLAHVIIHAALIGCVLAAWNAAFVMALGCVVLSHLLIDFGKSFTTSGALRPFVIDQAAHILVVASVAAVWPALWHTSLWANLQLPSGVGFGALPAVFALVAGAIACTRMGGLAVGAIMRPLAARAPKGGLPQGGAMIGTLERALIYVLILCAQPQGIGFLIAAKSILRFDPAAKGHTAANEYVIIGTLASFCWAITTAYLTRAFLGYLPDLGIPPLHD